MGFLLCACDVSASKRVTTRKENKVIMKFNKSNLEVKGKMSSKAADRVGYMLGTAALIAAILLGTAAILATL